MAKLTDKQLLFLANSAEFQKLLAEDPVLKELEASKFDPDADLHSLWEMFRGLFFIGQTPIQPLTPALWAFLWGIGNAYAHDFEKITDSDTDVFFFLLAHGLRKLDFTPSELPGKAAGFCASQGFSYEAAVRELVQVINEAFRPYEMCPKVKGAGDEAPHYDALWLAGLCSIVAQETNEPASEIMFSMPLSAANYYFVNRARREDPKSGIRRRTPGEVNKAIWERVMALAEQFCAAHCKED